MRKLESEARKYEKINNNILAINVIAGFSYSDVPENGVATQQYQVCVDTAALSRGAYRSDIEFVIAADDEKVVRGTTFIVGR